jgi:hypothetical protein
MSGASPLSLSLIATALVAGLAATTPSPTVHAETRRLAVLIGNNAGSGARPPLAYAETDAQKMAHVLVELGGVGAGDIELLRGQGLERVRTGLHRVSARVRQLQASATDRVVLVFYFSGHSDGQALEIGRERLSFAEVRRWMQSTGAAVRLAIVDSCRSGGLIALKGGRLGPVFDVRLADHLASDGEAIITSSSSSESALESAEIRSSFFSHHLISGLRGAADASGDGMVTLGEAYQYAFGRTVSATADTIIGPQHPLYDYRLTGRGDLVLTRIDATAGVLETPAGFDRLLLFDPGRQEVVAELGAGGARRLATRPGSYEVRAWRGQRVYRGRVAIAGGATARLAAEHLRESAGQAASAKGGEELWATPMLPAGGWSLALAAGVGQATGDEVGGVGGLRVELAPRSPWALVLSGATGRAPGYRETHLQVRAGRHHRLGGNLRLLAGVEVGAGLAMQALDGGRRLQSVTGIAAGVVGAEWQVAPALVLRLIADAPLVLARRERHLTPLFLPAAWLGARF